MSDWLCIIRPPRATFIADMRADERAVMEEHFAYVERLLGGAGCCSPGRRSIRRSGRRCWPDATDRSRLARR
jgi:hypothetical protein